MTSTLATRSAWDSRSKRSARDVDGTPLPNFERADDRVRDPDDRPAPAPVGFVAPGWTPRAGLAGTYDQAWTETRSPLLPTDFDPRFFDVAPPSLTVPGRLRGDEHGAALGVSPRGVLHFTLPGLSPTASVSAGTFQRDLELGLDRVVIDGDGGSKGEVVLVWSAGLRLPRDWHDVRAVTFAT